VEEVYQFIAFLLNSSAEPPSSQRDAIRSSNSLGMTPNQWEMMHKGVEFDASVLFQLLNENFKKKLESWRICFSG
jgi:hypothetical protein